MEYLQTYRQIRQVRVIVRERPLAGVTDGDLWVSRCCASGTWLRRGGETVPVALAPPAWVPWRGGRATVPGALAPLAWVSWQGRTRRLEELPSILFFDWLDGVGF